MIDTVKFSIPYEEFNISQIKKLGTDVVLSYNSGTKEIKFKIAKGDKALGSYDRNVNLFIREERKELSIELSLPKFIFGHNVFMIYPQEVEEVLYKLWANLNRVYNTTFPDPSKWKLLRLDLCYNWRFPSQDHAYTVLQHLKNITFPRKKRGKQQYDTGVFHSAGKLTSVKFYLKQPEFFAHDYKILKQSPHTLDLAYTYHTWSAGTLRFEVCLKKPYIDKEFPLDCNSYHIACKYDKILAILREFLSTYLKMINTQFIGIHEARKKLESIYPPRRASTLLSFWINSSQFDSETVINEIYKNINRSTLYRYTIDLKKADLGLFTKDDNIITYSLDVPSDLTTNPPILNAGESAEADPGEIPLSTNSGI